jgi:hypothetical protein
MSDEQPSRHGELWDESDYLAVAALARSGNDVEAVAHKVQRTTSAVLHRLRLLASYAGIGQPETLFATIADDEHFDLLALANDVHTARRDPLWTSNMDARLQQAWDEGQPMLEDLASELQVLPSRALDWLIRKGLAYDTGDVEQRLGLHPDQDIAARLRLSIDKTSVQLWVLVVTDSDGVVVHVSLHAQLAGAEATLEELRPASDDEPLDGPRNWQILPRVIGEPVNRNGLSGTFYPSPAELEQAPEPDLEPEQDVVIEQKPKRARRPRKPRAPRQPRGLADDDSVAAPRPPDNGAVVAPDA